MLAISFDECPPRRRSVGPATRLPDQPPCRFYHHRQEPRATCRHRLARAVAANVTIVRRAAVAMIVPVVPAEIDAGNTGPVRSGFFSGSFSGYFSSRVTLAAAAGAASTVTGVGSAFRIRFRTAACTDALY